MLLAIQIVLIAVIAVSSLLAFYFSTRFRRCGDTRQRGLFAAKMNISMGVMLIAMALIQIVLFEPDTIRIIVGAAFLLIGLFNLYAGLRNHGIYSGMSS